MHTEDQFSVLSHKVWLLNVIVKLSSSEDCENNCSYILAQCLLTVYVKESIQPFHGYSVLLFYSNILYTFYHKWFFTIHTHDHP